MFRVSWIIGHSSRWWTQRRIDTNWRNIWNNSFICNIMRWMNKCLLWRNNSLEISGNILWSPFHIIHSIEEHLMILK
jgi:hypothetical protein